MKKFVFLLFTFTSCAINRAQIDKDLDAIEHLQKELQIPIVEKT